MQSKCSSFTCEKTVRQVKGVPQGSVLGSVALNIFMNDLFFSVKNCSLYNYADDNTLLATGSSVSQIRNLLIDGANCIVSWCKINNMEANPSKFQVILANSKTNDFSITVDGTCIQADP